jgi:hypothetical protein
MTILPLACAFVFICYLFHFFYGLIYLWSDALQWYYSTWDSDH